MESLGKAVSKRPDDVAAGIPVQKNRDPSRVELYRQRFEQGLDIWTGKPTGFGPIDFNAKDDNDGIGNSGLASDGSHSDSYGERGIDSP